jgi:hypothetical protein
MASNEFKYHFTQVFDIKIKEKDLDFFDVNLKFDSPLFIDPFLLKNSSNQMEKNLFGRFGLFFKKAIAELRRYDIGNEKEKEYFLDYITFKECKPLYLGFTVESNGGHGPAEHLAENLFNFFIDVSLKKVIEDETLYPSNKLNPMALALVSKNIGPDSISDLSASLILDYLITYTQNICKQYGIGGEIIKSLPIPRYFNFDTQEWVEGGYADLPENPYNNQGIILVPKRLLRGYDIYRDRNITSKLQKILEMDPILKLRFADFIDKNVSDIEIEEVHDVLKNNLQLIKKVIEKLEIENPGEYDFVADPHQLLSIKKYSEIFEKLPQKNISDEKVLIDDFLEFLNFFQDYVCHHGGWKNFWIKNGRNLKECKEDAIGRQLFAMGLSWYNRLKNVTFCNEVSVGNGFVDFFIVYNECRIVVELKKLSNSQPTGAQKIPAYLHGCLVQLPEYAIQYKAKFAVYITAQHQASAERGKTNHANRKQEIESKIKDVEKNLEDKIENFETLHYVNIDVSPRATPSKK